MSEPISTFCPNYFKLDGMPSDTIPTSDTLCVKGKGGRYIDTGITYDDMKRYDIWISGSSLHLKEPDEYILEKLRRAGLERV